MRSNDARKTGPLCLVDAEAAPARFEAARGSVDVVCAGDSLTGWNNFGPEDDWPFPTYPRFLQEMLRDSGRDLLVANAGVAGEVSPNGIPLVERCVAAFPAARWFAIGFGTNDLGTSMEIEPVSAEVLRNLGRMVGVVRDAGRVPLLFNVPCANEDLFLPEIVDLIRRKRAHFNPALRDWCTREGIPLADIHARIRPENLGDPLHPNEAGARIIAEEIFKALAPLLPPSPSGRGQG